MSIEFEQNLISLCVRACVASCQLVTMGTHSRVILECS